MRNERERIVNSNYFEWLCSKVRYMDFEVSYFSLMKDLYKFKFVPIVSNDIRRCSDALELRREFVTEYGFQHSHFARGYNVLEVLISVASRMEYELSDNFGEDRFVDKCFWELIRNLGLDQYDDDAYSERMVRTILERFVNRKIDRKGNGGIFPMVDTKVDQRNVELFYQMQEYLKERHPI